MNAEDRARELGNSPKALRARFADFVSCLNAEGRACFRHARFDFEHKTLTGDGLRLVWKMRKHPDQPVSYENQQTSTGYVDLEAA